MSSPRVAAPFAIDNTTHKKPKAFALRYGAWCPSQRPAARRPLIGMRQSVCCCVVRSEKTQLPLYTDLRVSFVLFFRVFFCSSGAGFSARRRPVGRRRARITNGRSRFNGRRAFVNKCETAERKERRECRQVSRESSVCCPIGRLTNARMFQSPMEAALTNDTLLLWNSPPGVRFLGCGVDTPVDCDERLDLIGEA